MLTAPAPPRFPPAGANGNGAAALDAAQQRIAALEAENSALRVSQSKRAQALSQSRAFLAGKLAELKAGEETLAEGVAVGAAGVKRGRGRPRSRSGSPGGEAEHTELN